MKKINTHKSQKQSSYVTMTNHLLRDEFSQWFKSLYNADYRFYVTFRSRPIFRRRHLEGMIKEWSKRLNKKFIGRNWYKNSHADLRMKGVVFFEEFPDLHAHAIVRPPTSRNHQFSEYELIKKLQRQWSIDPLHELGKYGFTKPSAYEQYQDSVAPKNCINRGGDCLVQKLENCEDVRRASHYSLKQSRLLTLTENDDFKFIEDLESCRSNIH